MNVTKRLSNELRDAQDLGGAESGAVGDKSGPSDAEDDQGSSPEASEDSPELMAVVEAWPLMPEAVKAGILAMVRATHQSEWRSQARSRGH